MKRMSQRRIFTMLMTLFVTLTGAAYGAYELRGHSDIFGDVIKIGMLLAVVSVSTSFIIWTVTHLKEDTVFRGGLAGLLTALVIVPVPYFTAGLKTEASRLHSAENKSVLMSVLEAIPFAIKNGLETFLIISKVSLVAVIASVVLGVFIAKQVPSHQGPHSDLT